MLLNKIVIRPPMSRTYCLQTMDRLIASASLNSIEFIAKTATATTITTTTRLPTMTFSSRNIRKYMIVKSGDNFRFNQMFEGQSNGYNLTNYNQKSLYSTREDIEEIFASASSLKKVVQMHEKLVKTRKNNQPSLLEDTFDNVEEFSQYYQKLFRSCSGIDCDVDDKISYVQKYFSQFKQQISTIFDIDLFDHHFQCLIKMKDELVSSQKELNNQENNQVEQHNQKQCEKIDESEVIHQLIKKYQKTPLVDIYSTIIDVYEENNYPEQVFQTYEEMKYGMAHSERKILHFLNRKKDSNSNVLPEDSDKEVARDDIRLPIFSSLEPYKKIIKSCYKMGRLEDITDIITFLRNHNVKLDVEIYNGVLVAFIASGIVEAGLNVIERMKGENIEPNDQTISIMLQIFESSLNPGYESFYYNYISEKKSKNQDFVPGKQVFTDLLRCISRISKDLKKAMDLVKQMEEHNIDVDEEQYQLLLECCHFEKNWLDAIDIFNKVMEICQQREKTISTVSVNRIMSILAEFSNSHHMEILWNEIHQRFPLFQPNIETYNAKIKCLLKENNMEKARELLYQLMLSKNEELRPNIVSHSLFFKELYSTSWQPFMDDIQKQDRRSIFERTVKNTLRQLGYLPELTNNDPDIGRPKKRAGSHVTNITRGNDKD